MLSQGDWFSDNPNSAFVTLADNTEYAFNEFIKIACETGLVGLIVFIISIILILFLSFGRTKVLDFCGAIIVSLCVFSFFSYPLSMNYVVFFMIVIIALIANQIKSGRLLEINKFQRIMLVVILGFAMIISSRDFGLCKQVESMFLNYRNKLPSGFHKKYYSYMCNNSSLMLVYSKLLFDEGWYKEALPVMKKTIQLKASSELVSDYGFTCEKCGNLKDAEDAYKLAESMTPAYVKPSYRLFVFYKRKGDIELALKEAHHILSMKVKVVNTTVIRIRNEVRIFIKNTEDCI